MLFDLLEKWGGAPGGRGALYYNYYNKGGPRGAGEGPLVITIVLVYIQ